MAAPITTVQAGGNIFGACVMGPAYNDVVSTTTPSSGVTIQNQMVASTLDAVVLRPPYNYGQVAG